MNLVDTVENIKQHKKIYVSSMERDSGFQFLGKDNPHLETAVFKNPLGIGKPVAVFKMLLGIMPLQEFHGLVKQIIQNEEMNALLDDIEIENIANRYGFSAKLIKSWQLLSLSTVTFVVLIPKCSDNDTFSTSELPSDYKKMMESIKIYTDTMIKESEENEEKWTNFEGKPNIPAVLEEKAKALAPLLTRWSLAFSKNAVQLWADKDQAKHSQILIETILFFLHLTDRSAFEHLAQDNQKSNFFSQALYNQILKLLLQGFWTKDVPEEIRRSDFAEIYNERQAEYSNVKSGLFAAPSQNISDSLSWKFGNRVALIINPNEPNPLIILQIQGEVLAALVQMNIPVLLVGKAGIKATT